MLCPLLFVSIKWVGNCSPAETAMRPKGGSRGGKGALVKYGRVRSEGED